MGEKTYLAERLRSARKAAGLTLAEAGDQVGKSSKAISAYEASINEPSVDTLIGLCHAYDVGISYFFMSLDDKGTEADAEREREEADVLSGYRSLSTEGKRMVREYIDMVAERHPKSDDDKAGVQTA